MICSKGLISFEIGPFFILEVIYIQIRRVDPGYLSFLRYFDAKIPMKEDRPWLWPVRLEGIDYGIPLTTQDTGAGTIGFLRCAAVPEHGLYLRFMAPVPQHALQPPGPLTPELAKELQFYEMNRKYIEEEAKILHRLSGLGQMDMIWQHYSCNFAELDSVYFYWQPGFDAGLFLCANEEVFNMPVSKEGKAFYTKDQYEKAKYNSSALEYARSQGYDLVREGYWYKLKEHDSMVFTPQGTWFWNSRGVHGSALEFMIYYEGKTLVEAVLTLAGEQELVYSKSPERTAPLPKPDVPPVPSPARQSFKEPDRARDFRQLFYYLCSERGLEKSVVQEMIRQQRLYQSAYRSPSNKILTNATFVYRDSEGNAVGAFQRGMSDREGVAPYKRDVPGSDKRWGWLLAGQENASAVAVFEGAIDAASDASLAAMRDPNWQAIDRLSLEGLGTQPLQNYLNAHPHVRNVILMLDADEPGRNASLQIAEKLTAQGYTVEDRTPPFGKDWNEVLLGVRGMEADRQEIAGDTPAPQPQEAPEI